MFWCAWRLFAIDIMDQRICIKFCVKNKIKCSEVLKMLITAFCIYFEPKKCLYVVEKILMTKPILDAPAFQQPMKTFEAVEKTIMENRQIAIREVVEDVGKLVGSCLAIFSDVLAMKHVVAKFVAKLVNFDQNNHRLNITQELLNDFDDPDLLKRVITGNETWDMDMTSILRLN